MRSDPEAGRALTRSILRANRGGLQGWPLVDAMMQKQLEAGVTTVDDWDECLKTEGLFDSWSAWNADRGNPALAKTPPSRWTPCVVDRWEVDSKWREAKAAFAALPQSTPWRMLYGFLLDLRIREPGLLLRSVGITPESTQAIAEVTAGCTLLSNEEKDRIARGDDSLLFETIGRPTMTRSELDQLSEGPVIPEFVISNMIRYGHPDMPRPAPGEAS